jgi:hypothetical protein
MMAGANLSPVMKVLVAEFYRRNSGFFLVLALLLFGLFTAENHRMLADLAVRDLRFFALAYGFPWLLYSSKTLIWGLSSMAEPQNRFFLHHLSLLRLNRLLLILMQVQFALLLPVLPFFSLLIKSSVHQNSPFAGGLILLQFLMMIALPPLFWIQRLNRPVENRAGFSFPGFSMQFSGRPEFWFLRKLLREEVALLFFTKALSFFLLAGVSALFYTDAYDERLILLGIVGAGFCHLGLCDISIKLDSQMPWLRNLPLSSISRLRFKAAGWIPVLIPDLILLFRHCPKELGFLFLFPALAVLFCLALSLDCLSGLLSTKQSQNSKVLPVYFFCLGFAVMFSAPCWLLLGSLCLLILVLQGYLFLHAEV